MELQIDLSKEYGIVLEGGGARGSYQIGAWKALREAGLKIKGVAGASVGALNGALICMDDYEKALEIWENITYSQIMDVDDGLMENLMQKDLKAISLTDLLSNMKRVWKEKGFDITPLRNLIDHVVDEEKIRSSDRELYVTTLSITDRQELKVDVKTAPEGTIPDILLASAYFPAFKNEKLDGKRYMDGGGLNNVPVDILLEHDYKHILVIRIYGLGFDSEKVTKIPEDVEVYHIAPRQDLGGILEFDKKRSRRNITLGYYDAQRFLYGLAGKWYYIDAPGEESFYFNLLMTQAEEWKEYLAESVDEHMEPLHGYRAYVEEFFPRLAKTWKLNEEWDYRDLYIAILEDTAKRLRIKRFEIYTVETLLEKIREAWKQRELVSAEDRSRVGVQGDSDSDTDEEIFGE